MSVALGLSNQSEQLLSPEWLYKQVANHVARSIHGEPSR